MENCPLILPSLQDGEDKSSSLKNRIRKNTQHLRKWAKRNFTDCFRLYDRDIKEYPVAIDFYAGNFCIHYFSFDREEEETPPALREEVQKSLFSLFGAPPQALYERTRIRRKKIEQYERADHEKKFFTVREYGTQFYVNLNDYLDTGLFLDHRETRKQVSALSKDKRLLNLFAYTCSFSVQAALSGAAYTKSVDLSNTYTEWGKKNFLLNGIPLKNHEIIRGDCLKFLEEEIRTSEKYDLIVIDPPTLSRSKKMDQLFDIQADYSYLLNNALKLLHPEGTLFFSTNSRNFKFDISLFPRFKIDDITSKTLPLDFHNKKIHRCWKIKRKF